jgi:hypothetical protein
MSMQMDVDGQPSEAQQDEDDNLVLRPFCSAVVLVFFSNKYLLLVLPDESMERDDRYPLPDVDFLTIIPCIDLSAFAPSK